jgi:hypothetical protein
MLNDGLSDYPLGEKSESMQSFDQCQHDEGVGYQCGRHSTDDSCLLAVVNLLSREFLLFAERYYLHIFTPDHYDRLLSSLKSL